jgi:hypothetical protein
MKKRQSSPANTKVKSITSALPAAKRNLIQSRKSMPDNTGRLISAMTHYNPNLSFFFKKKIFPDHLDIETGITLING